MTDITEARKQLIALREEYGASSPIGSRASRAIEQLQNAEKAETPELREKLLFALVATLAEIAAIKHGAPADTQIRPRDPQ
jgi:hypothetical protein